jgi:hypothetical protein
MQPIRSYASVSRWMENVNRYYNLTDAEWEGRLETLRRFCEHVGEDPDMVIKRALEEKGEKVNFMRLLNQVSKALNEDARAAHDWNNVVRSFFIHNGARVVVKPYQ